MAIYCWLTGSDGVCMKREKGSKICDNNFRIIQVLPDEVAIDDLLEDFQGNDMDEKVPVMVYDLVGQFIQRLELIY